MTRLRHPLRTVRGRDLARWFPLIGRHRDYQRYVIFSMARSGSELLARRLDSHPQVEGLTEIFPDGAVALHRYRWWQPRFAQARRLERMERLRRDDPGEFIRQMAWGPMVRGGRAAGFKILWNQFLALPPDQRDRLLAVPGLRIIMLERRDVLGQRVSQLIAERFGIYHAGVGAARPTAPTIRLDPAEFAVFARARRVQTALIRRLIQDVPVLSMTYEDLVGHPARENARLCDFLGIDRVPLADDLRKVSGPTLATRISNIDEVVAALRGTDLEPYLAAAGIR